VDRPARRAANELGRRPWHAALAALVAGLLAASAPMEVGFAGAAIVVLALAALGRPALGLACGALLAAGVVGGALRVEALDARAALAPPGKRIEARALLLEAPRPGRFGASAALEVRSGPAAGALVLARGSRDARFPSRAGPGLELHVAGALRAPRVRPGSDFDWPAYLRRRGVGSELRLDSVRATGSRRGGVLGRVDAIRSRAEIALEAGLEPSQAALLRGMVLGQDERIAAMVREDFRRSGLAHLLAVSGQNVMLLGALALPILAAAGAGPRGRVVAVLALIAIYVPLAGAGPSLQRAGVMGAAGLLALVAGRPASRLYALLLAAAATLVLNPLVVADPGWQLSFAAVAGILVLASPLRRGLAGMPGPIAGLPGPLTEGIAVTVAATLATAPLLAHHFGSVSLASLPANVLALPAVAPIMWLGMLSIAVAQLSVLGSVATAVAEALNRVIGGLNTVPLRYVEGLAATFAEAPGAAVAVPLSGPARIAAAYGVLALCVLAAGRVARLGEPRATSLAAEWRRVPRARRLLASAGAAVLALAGTATALAPGGPPERLTVSFLDVGQGDATLVQHPDGSAILFDGGPEEARVARLVRGAGVKRLSAVVATHASADHHGGLVEVLRRVPTDLLLDGGDGNPDPAFRAVLAEADRRRIPRVPARAGRVLRAGGLTVRVIAPAPRPPGPAPEDPNPRALVAIVSSGDFDLFLSADAESEALAALPLPDVEAMKVPHHGSADPGLPGVLARLRPQVAGIEVGEGNGYGHPTPSTLAALGRAVPVVRRTDRDGTIRVSVGPGGAIDVETER
jgi:competence protein ComEC